MLYYLGFMCAVDWGGGGGGEGGVSTFGSIQSTLGVSMEYIRGAQYIGGLS